MQFRDTAAMLMAVWTPLILAPFVGSFLGVLIRRLPRDQPVLLARSRCDHCGAVLHWTELFPLLSFLATRGRCRHCRARIGLFYPAIECAALLVAAPCVALAADPAQAWAGCVLAWTLLALGWIDAEHLFLPDVLTLPLLLLGLAATWWLQPDALADHAAASLLAYAGLRLLGWAYARLRGREGIGQGDAKLLAASGAWLGIAALPNVLLLAALLGLGAAVPMLARGRDAATLRVPFGAPLALASWVVWLLTLSS